jgi:hypothetical protein
MTLKFTSMMNWLNVKNMKEKIIIEDVIARIEEGSFRKFVNSCKNTSNMIISHHLTT